MSRKRLLIIGFVWPEPTSSAAGTRMVQLIHFFIYLKYEITFACSASKSDFSADLQSLAVTEVAIKLNDSLVNQFFNELQPDVVLFDRFMIEEQYSWRIDQECPQALKILDTEDLHCLRYARQQTIKNGGYADNINLFTDIAKRELASILRCDLSLMISEMEIELLQRTFHMDSSLLFYLPFLEDSITEKQIDDWIPYENREGFVFIGNFLHEPNWHTLQFLKTRIWPMLRRKIPSVTLHIYGAYASQKVLQLHNKSERFIIHGRASDARDTLAKHRVLIAPIQFGAGVKGKFIDAMQVGTPSITTDLGAEAMKGQLDWSGTIVDDDDSFIEQAVLLYNEKERWRKAQQNGIAIINERYNKDLFTPVLSQKIDELTEHLTLHRQHNFIGQILQHHTTNSTKYMALWIEEKNKKRVNNE